MERIRISVRTKYFAYFTASLLLALSTLASSEAPKDCLGCHTASADKPIHAIMATAHGQLGEGSASCISCHGESDSHVGKPTLEAPDQSFGPRWALPAEAANTACQSCHVQVELAFWSGSAHEQEDLSCTSCHQLHEPAGGQISADAQLDSCLGCHAQVKAQLRLPHRHPILEGKTSCTDCHNPHGSSTDMALKAPTLNDSCYGCHAEKRGPYLWEHPPVAEDCSLCHQPHGSINERLLNSRAPFQCQQCHSAAFHPSLLNSGSTTGDRANNQNILGKSCLNCHSQVHGSNHPSGARLTR
jgi:DmsE family decaheme c-type cytochrome